MHSQPFDTRFSHAAIKSDRVPVLKACLESDGQCRIDNMTKISRQRYKITMVEGIITKNTVLGTPKS